MHKRWFTTLLGATALLVLFGCQGNRTSLAINGLPKDQFLHIQPLGMKNVPVHVADGYANYEGTIKQELDRLGYMTVGSAEGRNDVLTIKPTWENAINLPSPADVSILFAATSIFTLPAAMRCTANMNFEISRGGKIVAMYRYAVPYWNFATVYSPLALFCSNYLKEASMKADIARHMTLALHRDMQKDGIF